MKKTKMLKKNYEFKNVLSKGKYYSGDCIEAFITKSKQKEYNFLGIAISVKIAKAVKRNRIKRLIRENYRKIEGDINLGYNIVFLWKKKIDVGQANYKSIEKDIKTIFDRANLLKENL